MINGAENYSAERWDIFMKSDLMKVMMAMLQQNQLKEGLIILSRHEYEWERCVTPTVIKNFLHFIPDHVQTGEIQCILTETIVPTVARLLPQILVDVVKWIIQKAKSSELLDKKAWPVNALQFLRSVYGVLVKVVDISYSHSIYTAADITMKTQIERLEVLDLMKTLITNLQHLHDLQTKYNCKLTFGNFLQETTETVTFRMLDKVVAIEMINQTLERQIRPYMREYNLREDIIFSKYIKDLLERSGRMTSYLGEAVWEPKVIAIINCISSQQYKCDSILEVIKCAPIPWSKEINSLVQQALKLDHDLVRDIKEQVHLMELKKLMHKYNLKKEDIPSDNNWEMLMYYILSQNTTDSIEDAFNVMRGYNVILTQDLYVFRMRHLIKHGMVNECIDLLKSIPGNERLECGHRIVDYVKVLLNDTVELDVKELHKKKTLFTEAGCYIIKLIVDFEEDYMKSNELRNLLTVLQSLLALQKEYDQYITIDQYCDVNIRTKLLVTYAKQFFIKRESKKEEASKTKVFRLADILQISHVKIQGQLAIEAAKTGGIQTALKYCNMLLESDRTEETAETLYSVALSFLKLQADSENCDLTAGQLRSLPEVTYMLTSEALVVCSGHSDLFMKCLDLNKAASLALSVSQQCEAGDYSICEQEEEMNQEKVTPSVEMVSDWMSDSMFKEDALVMNSTVILPFISQYCVCHPTIDGTTEDAECIEKLTTSVKPVLSYLKDNSHIQLAFQTLLHMLYTVHQISLVNQMGIQLINETISEIMTEKKNDLDGIVKTTTPLIKEFTTGVLMKIFSNNFKDHHLALAYVLSGTKRDGQEAVMRIIKTSGHNYRRLRAISYVGIGAGEIYKDPNIINMCQRISRLSEKDAFQSAQSAGTHSDHRLPVAQSAGADTELIIDFASKICLSCHSVCYNYLAQSAGTDTELIIDFCHYNYLPQVAQSAGTDTELIIDFAGGSVYNYYLRWLSLLGLRVDHRLLPVAQSAGTDTELIIDFASKICLSCHSVCYNYYPGGPVCWADTELIIDLPVAQSAGTDTELIIDFASKICLSCHFICYNYLQVAWGCWGCGHRVDHRLLPVRFVCHVILYAITTTSGGSVCWGWHRVDHRLLPVAQSAVAGHVIPVDLLSCHSVAQSAGTDRVDHRLLPVRFVCHVILYAITTTLRWAQSAGADTEFDFCQAFEVDTDDGLLMYLEHVFTTTEHSTLSGQDVKKIQLKKAKTAIDSIRDEDTLYDKLRKLFYKTDPYDYEKLDFLMEEMRRINDTTESEKHAKVLFYLKQYKRRAPPSEFEINYRHQKDNEEVSMAPELRKDTISSWLPVSQSLKMSTDQIFIVTIKICQWNWQKKDANKELLTNVKSLLEKVSNCEMAMACAKWMVTQLPSGAEKVMGLEGCIYLAQKWYQALPESKTTDKEKAKAAVIKFNAMWRRLATEQILFLHGIRTPELHKQADKPKQLIIALYEHPCIVDTTEDADVPDIHAVVEEVANLNDINLQSMMVELLQKWLPSASSKQQDADTTATFNFDNLKLGNETVSGDDDEDDQNLKRVMYLLRRGDREQNLVYLIEFVFTVSIQSINFETE
ncbi:KNTC1 [Mytilus edulis]|uniref:KNTC1 n=1 Tax=Mytilus edulis TaxID=6550 RepID=A0A8S3U0D8_MYTED|nr:KNTC1 [Mytilus edulis]